MAIGLMVYRGFYFRVFDLPGILQSGFWFIGEFVVGVLVYRGFNYRAFDLSGFCYRANGHRAFGLMSCSQCTLIDEFKHTEINNTRTRDLRTHCHHLIILCVKIMCMSHHLSVTLFCVSNRLYVTSFVSHHLCVTYIIYVSHDWFIYK